MSNVAGKGEACAPLRDEAERATGARCAKLDIAVALSTEAARLRHGKEIYSVEADYLKRLSAVLKLAPPANASRPTRGEKLKAQIAGGVGRFRSVSRLFALAGLLPTFIRQTSVLQKALQANDEARHLVVSVASNRLQILQSDSSIKAELTTLTASIGGGRSPIEDIVGRADMVLVFDALPISQLWSWAGTGKHRDTVILDGAFLAFFLFRRLFDSAGRREILRAVGECLRASTRNGASFSTRKALLYTLILCGIWQALGGRARKEGLLVTSNSTLPELLRTCLFQSQDCDTVYEMMHGVGSICAQGILGSGVELGMAYGAHQKMVFVPQIPGLPLEGVFRNLAFDPATAVNCYLNKYFMKRRGVDIEAWVVEEFERLRTAAAAGDDPVVITIFGNFPNADKSSDSLSFRAEAALIGMIGRLSSAIGKEHIIVYAPHPGMGRAPSGHAQFVENRVQIHPDSVFCWLVSDLCVALNSSAMFEAVWFGASALTPMIPNDQFYSPAYLARVFHPVSSTSEELEEVARAFLASWRREPGLGGAERAKKRLKAMIGSVPGAATGEGLS